jgi:hypothetical protein
MNVILHQYVRMDIAVGTPARTEERTQVVLAVFVVDKARAAVVAALNQMKYFACDHSAWGAWHATMITRRPLVYVIETSMDVAVS